MFSFSNYQFILQQCMRAPIALYPCQYSVSSVFQFSHSAWYVVCIVVVFSIFLISNEVMHLFIWLLAIWISSFLKNILFIYLFLERGEGKEKDRERNISVLLTLVRPPLGPWPATQACALTRNWTSNPLVYRRVLNPLSQGWISSFWKKDFICF